MVRQTHLFIGLSGNTDINSSDETKPSSERWCLFLKQPQGNGGNNNKMEKIFKENIHWELATFPLNERYYVNNKYNIDDCWLRMNDFPEEPLWTLFCLGKTIDFDDFPKKWTIKYPD